MPKTRLVPAPRRRLVAALVAALVAGGLLAAPGCRSNRGTPAAPPLSRADFDEVYLRSALKELIHDVFTQGDPTAFEKFFPPRLRGHVDTEAMYEKLVGAPPGVYQPRIWNAEGVQVTIDDTGTRAGTLVRIEFVDLRPAAGGAGKYITLNLTWSKQEGIWYLVPLSGTVKTGPSG
jgi:hypothetical protein